MCGVRGQGKVGQGDASELQCETGLVVPALLPFILQVAQDEKTNSAE